MPFQIKKARVKIKILWWGQFCQLTHVHTPTPLPAPCSLPPAVAEALECE